MEAAAFLGFISVAKDLADISREAIKFTTRVVQARARLEEYCKEVKALEDVVDIAMDDPALQSPMSFLKHETDIMKSLVNSLAKKGIRARFRFAWKDKDLNDLLQVIDRARGTLHLLQSLQHAKDVRTRLCALQAQNDVLIASQQTLLATTIDIQVQVRKSVGDSKTHTAASPWLLSLLKALFASNIHRYDVIPRFAWQTHRTDSVVVNTLLDGSRNDILRLLKSGEMHPGHFIAQPSGEIPLYLFAVLHRGDVVRSLLLHHCEMSPNVFYEVVRQLSSYQHASNQDFTSAFEHLIVQTDVDIALNGHRWLGDIKHIGWHNFACSRLLDGKDARPIEMLHALDPCESRYGNMLALLTLHGIHLFAISSQSQITKNWLLHAFLAKLTYDGNMLHLARSCIIDGADPNSVVHGRGALATIFVAARLDHHLLNHGRSRSIFASWFAILRGLGIHDFGLQDMVTVSENCYNEIARHQIKLLKFDKGDLQLEVRWQWRTYESLSMPGKFPVCIEDKGYDMSIDFAPRDQTWKAQDPPQGVTYKARFQDLLDDLGYQNEIRHSQDDHDRMSRSMLRRQRLTSARRAHSCPRTLQGLRWIPHPGRFQVDGTQLICPFTSICYLGPRNFDPSSHDFVTDLGRCMGLKSWNSGFQPNMLRSVLTADMPKAQKKAIIAYQHRHRLSIAADQFLARSWLQSFEEL